MATPVGRLGGAVALALVCLSVLLGVVALRADTPDWSGTPAVFAAASAVALLCAVVVGLGSRRVVLQQREARARDATARGLESLISGSSDLILVTDSAGIVSYSSPAVGRILGLRSDDLMGNELAELVRQAEAPAVREAVDRLSRTPDVELTLELAMNHVDGGSRLLECRVRALSDDAGADGTAGLIWNIRDVTERRALEQELANRAFHDALTGVPNRTLLVERLGRALERANRHQSVVGMIVVGFEDLDEVRDGFGHTAGDEVAATAATRLQASARPGDTVARLGGDEFAVLLDELTDVDEALAVAERALASLSEPLQVAGRSLILASSAGVATNRTADARSGADGILRDAQVARHAARVSSSQRCMVFEEPMRERAEGQLDLSVDIVSAAADGQIQVLYQPLIHLETGELEGFEALARWHHPAHGPVPPVTFIPVAEDSGAIHDIGRHVLETACRQAAAWTRPESGALRISVNVSPFQLAGDEIVDQVREALEVSGLAPRQLILEMTESALVHDLTSVARRLQRLRVLGVRIAMDDFGTGYSALAYLRRLPLDIVKIDKSFVDDEHGAGPHLLASVIAMGNSLGLDTVAEGIEDQEQLDRARVAGCTFGQGYLIARPLDADAATDFLNTHTVHLDASDAFLMSPPQGSPRS